MRRLISLCLVLTACTAADVRPSARVVRVGIGDDWATSYDGYLAAGVAILRPTGWTWVLVERGHSADVVVEHSALESCAAGEYRGGDRVHVDPVCASGALPTVVAHELLLWAGCGHVARGVLGSRIVDVDGCDSHTQSCVPSEMSADDLREFNRATGRRQSP
jgi:hypothetical protein